MSFYILAQARRMFNDMTQDQRIRICVSFSRQSFSQLKSASDQDLFRSLLPSLQSESRGMEVLQRMESMLKEEGPWKKTGSF